MRHRARPERRPFSHPAGPRLAFTFGFAAFAVETDAGDGVVAGKDTLTILGVTYRRTSR